jgi:ABC-type transporter Mla MlaB component
MIFAADPGLWVGMDSSRPSTITFAIWGPIEREDVPGLCRRLCALLERTGAPVAWCDVSDVAADAVAVDALARLQLTARRHRCQIRLRGASDELRDLVAFMGLEDVLTS